MEALYGCNPTPQVDKLAELVATTAISLLTAELALLTRELASAETKEGTEPATELVRAAEITEVRLASSAEFVMELMGMKLELMMETVEIIDWETELMGYELALLGDTKLRLVVGAAEEEALLVKTAFLEVLQTIIRKPDKIIKGAR